MRLYGSRVQQIAYQKHTFKIQELFLEIVLVSIPLLYSGWEVISFAIKDKKGAAEFGRLSGRN